MRGRDGSHRGLVHLIAGMALGAAAVLVAWIVAGGTPFGHVIGGDDVSAPTSPLAAQTAAERRAGTAATRASRLAARPPELVAAPELRFMEPKRSKASRTPRKAAAKARTARPRTAKPRRPARPRPRPSTPVVRVLSPPGTDETAAVAPVPTATPVPAPPPAAAPPAPAGAGGGPARPRPAGGTMEG